MSNVHLFRQPGKNNSYTEYECTNRDQDRVPMSPPVNYLLLWQKLWPKDLWELSSESRQKLRVESVWYNRLVDTRGLHLLLSPSPWRVREFLLSSDCKKLNKQTHHNKGFYKLSSKYTSIRDYHPVGQTNSSFLLDTLVSSTYTLQRLKVSKSNISRKGRRGETWRG